MGYAVTHVITTLVLVDLFRHHVYRFDRKYLILAALFALVPDVDIIVGGVVAFLRGTSSWTALVVESHALHGMMTHAFLWPFLLAWLSLFLHLAGKKRATLVTGLLACTWAWHILLDLLVHGESYPMVLWPLFSGVLFSGILPLEGLAPLDAALLILWLLHEEYAHKIRAYF